MRIKIAIILALTAIVLFAGCTSKIGTGDQDSIDSGELISDTEQLQPGDTRTADTGDATSSTPKPLSFQQVAIVETSVAITSIAWSSDSQRIATSGREVYDRTGKYLLTLEGVESMGGTTAISWSGDGTKIAGGSDLKGIIIWDASNGNVLRAIDTQLTRKVAWSPDSKKIASGSGDEVIIFGASSGAQLQSLKGHREVRSIAWNPDSSQLAASGKEGNEILVWDTSSGVLLSTIVDTDEISLGSYGVARPQLDSISWSPDGKKIASAASNFEKGDVWDASTGAHIIKFENGRDTVSWSQDSARLVSRGPNYKMAVYDAKTGVMLNLLPSEGDFVPLASSWSKDGKKITASRLFGGFGIWEVS